MADINEKPRMAAWRWWGIGITAAVGLWAAIFVHPDKKSPAQPQPAVAATAPAQAPRTTPPVETASTSVPPTPPATDLVVQQEQTFLQNVETIRDSCQSKFYDMVTAMGSSNNSVEAKGVASVEEKECQNSSISIFKLDLPNDPDKIWKTIRAICGLSLYETSGIGTNKVEYLNSQENGSPYNGYKQSDIESYKAVLGTCNNKINEAKQKVGL